MANASNANPIVYVEANTVSIVQKYIQQCKKNLPELFQAIERQDFSFLIQEAHKIKGTGGLMSVTNLHVLGEKLETAARANNFSEARSLLQALAQFLETVTVVAQQ